MICALALCSLFVLPWMGDYVCAGPPDEDVYMQGNVYMQGKVAKQQKNDTMKAAH